MELIPPRSDWSSVEELESEGRLPDVGDKGRVVEAMERAVVCRADDGGRRMLRADCGKKILDLPAEFRDPGASDAESLEAAMKQESAQIKEVYANTPPEELESTLNLADEVVDSDDSAVAPEEDDMELYHLYVQLASGTGKVHKDAAPRCGSHGTRFSDLQIGHDWGHTYSLCTKCFGKDDGEGSCPLLCDFVTITKDGVFKRCGRRCHAPSVQGHQLPSEPGFSAAARHRCALHSEVVQDEDI